MTNRLMGIALAVVMALFAAGATQMRSAELERAAKPAIEAKALELRAEGKSDDEIDIAGDTIRNQVGQNPPTFATILSVISVLAVIAGIGGLAWAFAGFLFPIREPLGRLSKNLHSAAFVVVVILLWLGATTGAKDKRFLGPKILPGPAEFYEEFPKLIRGTDWEDWGLWSRDEPEHLRQPNDPGDDKPEKQEAAQAQRAWVALLRLDWHDRVAGGEGLEKLPVAEQDAVAKAEGFEGIAQLEGWWAKTESMPAAGREARKLRAFRSSIGDEQDDALRARRLDRLVLGDEEVEGTDDLARAKRVLVAWARALVDAELAADRLTPDELKAEVAAAIGKASAFDLTPDQGKAIADFYDDARPIHARFVASGLAGVADGAQLEDCFAAIREARWTAAVAGESLADSAAFEALWKGVLDGAGEEREALEEFRQKLGSTATRIGDQRRPKRFRDIDEWHAVPYWACDRVLRVVMGHDWQEWKLLNDTLITFLRIAMGFCWAALLAVPLGILMGSFVRFRAFFEPLRVFGLYVPLPLLLLLFMAIFGLSEQQKVAFVALSISVVLLPNTILAVESVPQVFIDTGSTLGATRAQIVRRVLVGISWGDIFRALRLGFAVGWTWILVAEAIGAESGLGYRASVAQKRGLTSIIYFIIIEIVFLGYVINKLWAVLEGKLFPYRQVSE